VIEDAFCAGRPDWDRVGATFTSDVHAYEMMKIRILNAGHQVLANAGELLSVPPSPTAWRTRHRRSGATQKSQSWPSAPVSAKKATAVERAGLTEVLVTGIEIRWMSVRPRPMAIGAKPAGALARWRRG
jgi:hypothetical protein